MAVGSPQWCGSTSRGHCGCCGWSRWLRTHTHTHRLWSHDFSSSSNTSQPQPQPRPPRLTSPVIGHHQKVLLLDVEGLQVHRRVRLQRLVLHKAPPPPLPAVDDRQLQLRLPGIGHRQKHLKKNSKSPVKLSRPLAAKRRRFFSIRVKFYKKLSLSSCTCLLAVLVPQWFHWSTQYRLLLGGQSETFLHLKLLELSPRRRW